MNNALKYKGYTAQVQLDLEEKILHGRVLGIKDVISFESNSPEQIEKEFRDSIDDYLDFCKSIDREPEKPFTEKVILELSNSAYSLLEEKARQDKTSIENEAVRLIEDGIERATGSNVILATAKSSVTHKKTIRKKKSPSVSRSTACKRKTTAKKQAAPKKKEKNLA